MTHLLARLLEAMEMTLPAGRYVLCLGGGADSAVAAWATTRHAGPQPVRAVFVHHGLSGSPSLAEAAGKLAASLGVRLDVLEAPVAPGPGLESRARAARLLQLERCCEQDEWLVTGHTRDDQAETILANLLRGAGARGLAGIPPRRGRWVRPLLGFSRDELRGLAVDLGLPFADDPANTDPRFLRNRLRHQVIPDLERGFNPALRRVLARSARYLGDDDKALEEVATSAPLLQDEGAFLLAAPALFALPRAVRARAVRRALRHLLDPYPGTAADVEAVLAVAAGKDSRRSLSRGCVVEREGPYLAILPNLPQRSPRAVQLSVPGTVTFGGRRVDITLRDRVPALRRGDSCYLNGAVLGGEVEVRVPETGDRIEIATGNKTVMRALSEASIPRRKRATWPLLTVHAKIAAVAGVRAAAWAGPVPGSTVAAVTVRRGLP